MHTTRVLSAVAALSIAGGIAASTSAQADPALGPNVVPAGYYQQYSGPPQCWVWGGRPRHWIWVCGPQPQYQPVYPQYYPYYAPAPFFGFSFGGGGYDHDRHDRHDRH
jgi:hypothetical protein